jgi:hypothetical protein
MGETFELMGSGMNFSYTPLPSIDGNYGSLVSRVTTLILMCGLKF